MNIGSRKSVGQRADFKESSSRWWGIVRFRNMPKREKPRRIAVDATDDKPRRFCRIVAIFVTLPVRFDVLKMHHFVRKCLIVNRIKKIKAVQTSP